MGTVRKKVYFYLMRASLGDDPVKPREVLAEVEDLWAKGEQYMPTAGGRALSCQLVNKSSQELHHQLGWTRYDELPQVDRNGKRYGLNLQPDEGIYEPTHFGLFGHEVLACESSYFGPRPHGLKGYLPNKLPHVADRVELVELLNPEAYQQLKRLADVRLFHMSIHRGVLGQIADLSPDLHTAFKGLANAGDSETLEVGLRPPKNGRVASHLPWLGGLADWLTKTENRLGVVDLRIKGMDDATGRIQTLDLLEPVIMHAQEVVLTDAKHRVVQPESMFTALRKGYSANKPHIERAVERAKKAIVAA